MQAGLATVLSSKTFMYSIRWILQMKQGSRISSAFECACLCSGVQNIDSVGEIGVAWTSRKACVKKN
jgi:hypothetical protein